MGSIDVDDKEDLNRRAMDAEGYVEKLVEIVREVKKVDSILKTYTKDDGG